MNLVNLHHKIDAILRAQQSIQRLKGEPFEDSEKERRYLGLLSAQDLDAVYQRYVPGVTA